MLTVTKSLFQGFSPADSLEKPFIGEMLRSCQRTLSTSLVEVEAHLATRQRAINAIAFHLARPSGSELRFQTSLPPSKLGGEQVSGVRYLVAKCGYHPHKADGMPTG